MRVVWGLSNPEMNEALANWCAAQLALPRPFQPPYTAMGTFDGELLVAVHVFNNFYPETGVIEMHGAAITPRWMTRPVLKELFTFAYERCGCQNVVMRVSERNTRLHRQLVAYGFKHVTIPRLRGRDEAERIYWLTDDAWRSNGFHRS